MVIDDRRYIIGIDLGTTNSAVSFVDLAQDPDSDSGEPLKKRIEIFKVPQLTGSGELTRVPVLPSFLYIPGTYDISKDAISHPWKTDEDNFAGIFARDHGSKVPARLVSSAKSWLCNNNADRQSKILPWGSGDDVYKVSPIHATASYLTHLKKAWNYYMGDDEDRYFENQVIIITVPASFDEVARDLTVEAAAMAGLKNVTLLEEPLAAFYSWLIRHEHDWHQSVKENQLILVCDVGGGTTDFTLITLREVDGSPRFERIAVGDHLILGGDNIDLALARHVESGFGKNKPALTGDKWKTLCHQCRQSKEHILDGKTDSETITIMGEGRGLIAGTVSSVLTRDALEKIVLDGFFPVVDSSDIEQKNVRKGITEFGLPYEQETAMTRHLGWFLDHHKADVGTLLNKEPFPDLILFNGGSLKPEIIQERIRRSIRHWYGNEDKSMPMVLENPDPDLAVALGASYYGLVKIGKGVRVGSGSARSYYLAVSKKDDATENNDTKHAMCIVERGLNEGSKIELNDQNFEVLTNQKVSFDMFSSSFRSGDTSGRLIEIDDTLTPLPPIQTVIQFGQKGVKTNIPVKVEAEYTEMGTLALWCKSLSSDHRWQLQFQLRDALDIPDIPAGEIFDDSVVKKARTHIKQVFSDKNSASKKGISPLTNLVKDISDIADRQKEKWPLSFIRNISDELIKQIKKRSYSVVHESRWLNLAGFCMRPGFGEGFDEHRTKKIWKIYKQGAHFSRNVQVRSEWWILWRRIAGGLKAGHQRQIVQDLSPLILSNKGGKPKIPSQELLEIWMAVANMERLLVKDKIKWGKYFLSELSPKKCRYQHFWSLSRIGARELLYGSVDRIVPPDEVAAWIETLLSMNWNNPKPVGTALAQLGRRTGDRMRDIDEKVIDSIIDRLSQYDFFDIELRYLKEVVAIDKSEENTIFGEDLPVGIVLHA